MSENTTRPLGEWLSQRREQLNISLEKAETETRIRAPYLRALEAEDLEALPNPVVARGFLRNYAAYLGLDAREAASRYTGLAAPGDSPPPAERPVPVAVDMFRPVPLHNVPGRRRSKSLTFGLILIPVLLALLFAWGWWNYPWVTGQLSRLFGSRPTATRAAAPATATLTPSTEAGSTVAPTFTLEPAAVTLRPTTALTESPTPAKSPLARPTSTSPIYTGVFVELYFLQNSWVQVTVDGTREFQGELQAEARRSWYGNSRVELRIGNAGGVQVTVNGRNLGTLGAIGEVVDRVFETAEAALTSAPGITPTLELTMTATATLTPLPSAAPLITPTGTITP